MIRLIFPITPNEYYNIKEFYNSDIIQKVNDFLNTINNSEVHQSYAEHSLLSPKKIVKFVKYNYDTIYYMIKSIPFPILLSLYNEYNFMANHFSEDLINTLLKNNYDRFIVSFLNGDNYHKYLIPLNNQYNFYYNFTNNLFNKRLDSLKLIFDMINFSQFYFGTNMCLYLGSNQYHKREPSDIIFKLYPKYNNISLPGNNYFKSENKNHDIIIDKDNFKIIIHNRYYENIGQIFYSTDEKILCDDKLIYCLPDIYQSLSGNNVNDLMIKYSLDNDAATFIYNHKNLVKYHQTKLFNFPQCYICRKFYLNNDTFDRYYTMCLQCGIFNYKQRFYTANLSNIVAFVSGIRQKIGYCIALKLLRAGATVIGTSRFYNITNYNYKKNNDYNEWKDRLIICSCDFTDISQVNDLISFLKKKNLNIIINNACQTIRPSNNYIKKLLLLENHLSLNFLEYDNAHRLQTSNHCSDNSIIIHSQIDSNFLIDNKIVLNNFHDIVDDNIKQSSSWNKKIDQIDPREIFEAIIINQTVPTLFVNQLKSTMKGPKFIINVTALEGQFNTKKNANHLHTNMCKSAMDMMIRTLFEEQDPELHVYCINPGFVSGVNPQHEHFPLSPEDAASRILNPIFRYFNGDPIKKTLDNIKLKNYFPEPW